MFRSIVTWFVALATLVIGIHTMTASPRKLFLEKEKRNTTEFPELMSFTHTDVKDYFRQMEMYFNDRLAGRDTFLYLASLYVEKVDTDNPFQGKDGWLFLGDRWDHCVKTLTGEMFFTAKEIQKRVSMYSDMRDLAEKRGMEFHLMVAPNKSTIYAEYLPSSVIPAKNRFVTPLIKALQAAGIDVFDSAPVVKQAKSKGCMYLRTDTHWNRYGACEATKAFMQHCHMGGFPEYVMTPQKPYAGDLVALSGKNVELKAGDNYAFRWKGDFEKRPKNILILGDSFSEVPAFFIKNLYQNVHRVHYRSIDQEPGEKYADALGRYIDRLPFKPNIILWIQVERLFYTFCR